MKKKKSIKVEIVDNPDNPGINELKPVVKCKRCNREVDNTNKAKWEHAARYHTDMFLQMLHDKIFTNNRGTDGLYGIGFELGKQLQADGVGLVDITKSFAKGIKQWPRS